MKILSIRQPWAWAIIHGYKDVENRTWKTNFRGKILIHTSLEFDINGWKWINDNMGVIFDPYRFCIPRWGQDKNPGFSTGGIIGSVELVDCVIAHDSPWFSGPYGFILKNPQPLPFQPCKGQLGFFEINPHSAGLQSA